MNNLNGPDSVKKGDYGYSSESLSRRSGRGAKSASQPATRAGRKIQKKNSKKLRNSTILSMILVFIQLGLSGYFVYLLYNGNLAFITLPIFAGIAVGLIFFLILAFCLGNGKKIATKRAGKVVSIIVSLALLAGIYFISPWGTMEGAKVDENPFVVFVSATDTFGARNTNVNDRSDTNIVAAVNPKTHTVMMVSIPRDYYIPVYAKSVDTNASLNSDKLTHIGLYGNGQARSKSTGEKIGANGWNYACEVSWDTGKKAIMKSLKKLLKFNADSDHYHYAQLNFTGFADMIDELGGVTVDVEKGFTYRTYDNYKEDSGRRTYKYKKGEMEMDGNEALTYARTRKVFADGDLQRNKNQVAVLKAVSDKVLSPAVLPRYRSVVNSINDCLDTDIDLSSMASLQSKVSSHKNYDGWKIVSYSVIGEPASQPVLWNGQTLSVVLQNNTSVNHAHTLLNKALAGTKSKQLKKLSKQYTDSLGE